MKQILQSFKTDETASFSFKGQNHLHSYVKYTTETPPADFMGFAGSYA